MMRQIYCLLLVSMAFAPASILATTHNLSQEWSDIANPFGSWALMKNPTQVFTINQSDYYQNGSNIKVWADQPFSLLQHVPMWTNWKQVSSDFLPGDIMMHTPEFDRTGTNVTSAVWTAPSDGVVLVEGKLWAPTYLFRTNQYEIFVGGQKWASRVFTSDGSVTRQTAFPFVANLSNGGPILTQILAGQKVELRMTAISESGNLGDTLGLQFKVHHGPQMILSGTLSLEDWVRLPYDSSPELLLQETQNTEVVWRTPIVPDASGHYSVLFPVSLEPGTYRCTLKASHWLGRLAGLFSYPGQDVDTLNATLVNGDVDGDNEVGPGDFGFLSAAFGSVPGDGNWDVRADLDGDMEVGPSDFGVLSSNFGEAGD